MYRTSLFLIIALSLAIEIIIITPSFAQVSEPLITVFVDKSSYVAEDTIVISGAVKSVVEGMPLTIQILDPVRNQVQIGQVDVGQDGKYATIIIASASWQKDGTYTVKVQYGPPNVVAETNFEFSGGTGEIKNSNPRVTDALGNTLTSVKVNQQVLITSDITNLQNIDQPFTFAVKIFKEGIMVNNPWITGSLAPKQTFNPSLSWTPVTSGTYTAQIFVLESMDNPVQLAQPLSITLVVKSSQPEITVSTDRSSYRYGDTIIITGHVTNPKEGLVTLRILDTNSKVLGIDLFTPATDGSFSRTYVAIGPLWIPTGMYTVIAQYAFTQQAETTFSFSGSTGRGIDNIPPLLLVPSDMLIEAAASGTFLQYNVKAIDNEDGVIRHVCDPSTGSFFPIGNTKVTCSAKDSAGNSATASFTITVKTSSLIIPDWIRDVAGFWCNDEIEDSSFAEAIQYLINNKVIIVPETTSALGSGQQIPAWVKNNACWWSTGQISNNDFASAIQYLISVGIIRV